MKGLKPHADKLIGKVLLRIREPSPCLSVDEQFAVTGSGLEQDARRVADDSRHLARFVTTGAKLVNSFVVIKRIHGTLATYEQYRIEVSHIYTRQRPRVVNELHVLKPRNESETEHARRGIAVLVPGVASFISFEFAAFRAANLDRVTMFHEFPVWMHQLAPPEANRPRRQLGNRRV